MPKGAPKAHEAQAPWRLRRREAPSAAGARLRLGSNCPGDARLVLAWAPAPGLVAFSVTADLRLAQVARLAGVDRGQGDGPGPKALAALARWACDLPGGRRASPRGRSAYFKAPP